MTEYCLGFAFGPTICAQSLEARIHAQQTHLALVHKKRPEWQAGLLNGIGGHLESNETPVEAQIREFFEETGISVERWHPLCRMESDEWVVHVFRAFGTDFRCLQPNKTDEEIRIVPAVAPPPGWCVPNLHWLIPLALDRKAGGVPVVRYP